MEFVIRRRNTGASLWSGPAETAARALTAAVQAGADLSRADLSGADLAGAVLAGADLSGADLAGAVLYRADLAGADLSWAVLYRAVLDRADLAGADLSWAVLYRAVLDRAGLAGARLNWDAHDLVAELLLRAAGSSARKRRVAGLVLVSRDWCWDRFLRLKCPRDRAWALGVLAPYVREGDRAPAALRRAARALDAGGPPAPAGGGDPCP